MITMDWVLDLQYLGLEGPRLAHHNLTIYQRKPGSPDTSVEGPLNLVSFFLIF